jgi:CyaY protein
MSETVSERDFETYADRELRKLERALTDGEGFEVDLESGILTISFDDGTRYVVNSHRAARQIWMAAERSAWHFDYLPAEARWVAAKSGDELWSAVARVLTNKLGAAFHLAS